MNRFAKLSLLLAAALLIVGLAVVVKRNHLESGYVSAGKTQVNFNITVRGTGGRAVKNSRISLYDPEKIELGITDQNGSLSQKELVNSGRSVILQAEGIAFKMQRVVLIPRSATYNATLFFDLAEVHEGNATLVSAANTESTSLVKVQTPAPTLLSFELQNSKVSNDAKSEMRKWINSAASKLGITSGIRIKCTSWEGSAEIHECGMTTASGKSIFRLFRTLPLSEQASESWLKDFDSENEPGKEFIPENSDLVFNVRHGGEKFRVYYANKPLVPWKEKKTSNIYRVNKSKMKARENDDSDLTIITESQQVLQRKISSASKKRAYRFRIPNYNGFELSQREGGSSIAR
ncbi:MAG: hypothetical protein ACO3A4_06610 [Silvanigrellaceae bacterium]